MAKYKLIRPEKIATVPFGHVWDIAKYPHKTAQDDLYKPVYIYSLKTVYKGIQYGFYDEFETEVECTKAMHSMWEEEQKDD